MRFRTHELLLGVFLTVAVFAMGMVFSSSRSTEPPKVYVLEKAEASAKASLGFWEKVADDPVALFTAFLVASTLLLWWATWRIGVRQSKETKILQRAYVSVEPLGVRLMRDGSHLIGHASIKNAGNLPATNLSWWINIKHSTTGEEADFPIGQTKGNIVVAPHSETTRGSDNSLVLPDLLTASNAGNIERHNENPLFIYVWGVVRYHDGFTADRSTQFCHRYNWINRPEIVTADNTQYELDKEFSRLHTDGNATT